MKYILVAILLNNPSEGYIATEIHDTLLECEQSIIRLEQMQRIINVMYTNMECVPYEG